MRSIRNLWFFDSFEHDGCHGFKSYLLKYLGIIILYGAINALRNNNLAIFRQTDNGVLVRMALFALVLDVVEQVDRHARDVNWYTAGRF